MYIFMYVQHFELIHVGPSLKRLLLYSVFYFLRSVVGIITQSPESTNFALDLHFLSRPSLFDTKPSLQVGVQKAWYFIVLVQSPGRMLVDLKLMLAFLQSGWLVLLPFSWDGTHAHVAFTVAHDGIVLCSWQNFWYWGLSFVASHSPQTQLHDSPNPLEEEQLDFSVTLWHNFL